MARPPIPPGKTGSVSVTEVAPKVFRARCRYRGADGRSYWIERRAQSKTAARENLRRAVTERRSVSFDDLKQDYAKFSTAVELYRNRLDRQTAEGAIRDTTAMRYRSCLVRINDSLGSLRLAEITTGRLSLFIERLAEQGLSAESRRLHRAVLGNILKMLAQRDIVSANLLLGLDRIHGKRKSPRALTAAERQKLLAWCDTDPRARERGLPDLVRFMLGTGCRIGEALAVRWQDVDLDGVSVQTGGAIEQIPVVAVTGNIVDVKGSGLARHPGKTESALRVIPLPVFVADMLRARRTPDAEPGHPVFPAQMRNGEIGYKRPSLVQGWMRELRQEVGMPWFTTHHLRKTAATILHDAGLPDRQIGGITGHADLTTLLNVYIGRGELHPQAAAALDVAYRDR